MPLQHRLPWLHAHITPQSPHVCCPSRFLRYDTFSPISVHSWLFPPPAQSQIPLTITCWYQPVTLLLHCQFLLISLGKFSFKCLLSLPFKLYKIAFSYLNFIKCIFQPLLNSQCFSVILFFLFSARFCSHCSCLDVYSCLQTSDPSHCPPASSTGALTHPLQVIQATSSDFHDSHHTYPYFHFLLVITKEVSFLWSKINPPSFLF